MRWRDKEEDIYEYRTNIRYHNGLQEPENGGRWPVDLVKKDQLLGTLVKKRSHLGDELLQLPEKKKGRPRVKIKPLPFHKCFHTKLRTSLGFKSALWKDGSAWQSYDPLFGPIDQTIPDIPEIDSYDYEAINSITPKLKADLSVPNFLFELKDLKKVIPSSQQLQRISAALIALTTNPFKGGRRWGASELHNAAAGQHLSAQFGYLPLIDDAFNLVLSIDTFNQRVFDFQKRAGKPQTGYYRKVLPTTVGEKKYGGVSANLRPWTRDSIIRDTVTYGVRYTYSLEMGSLKVPSLFYKYMGFRANPRILWDAIPFSFIVDWFFGIGSFLAQFDAGAVPVNMHIISGWRTRKTTIRREHGFEAVPHASGYWVSGPGLYATTEFTVYERLPWVFDTSVLGSLQKIQLQKVTRNKVMLASSLGKVLTHKG